MKRLSIPYRGHCRGHHPATDFALSATKVAVSYAEGNRAALEDISLEVGLGQRVALVGSNGAGKSTLLQAAAGLLPIKHGEMTLFGLQPGACQHQVVYLPQLSNLDWTFPISLERLALTGRYVHLGWLKRPGPEDFERVQRALDLLGLSALANRQISQLSGGEQQRVLLARALVHEADLLLLDEPLNAVDLNTRHIVEDVLVKLRNDGKTVIIATHDLGRLEADFDSAIYLNEGRVVDTPPGAFGCATETC